MKRLIYLEELLREAGDQRINQQPTRIKSSNVDATDLNDSGVLEECDNRLLEHRQECESL